MNDKNRIPMKYIVLALVLILGLITACGGTEEAPPATEETAVSTDAPADDTTADEATADDVSADDATADDATADDATADDATADDATADDATADDATADDATADDATADDATADDATADDATADDATADGFNCRLDGFDDCTAIGTVTLPADADESLTGANLYIANSAGNMTVDGFVSKGSEIPLYWQSGGYYATWDINTGPRWISEDYVQLDEGDIHVAPNTSDWTANEGGGTSDKPEPQPGGAPPTITMETGRDEQGEFVVYTINNAAGMSSYLEDHLVDTQSLSSYTIRPGDTFGVTIEKGHSYALKLVPVGMDFVDADNQGLIIHGPDFWFAPDA